MVDSIESGAEIEKAEQRDKACVSRSVDVCFIKSLTLLQNFMDI